MKATIITLLLLSIFLVLVFQDLTDKEFTQIDWEEGLKALYCHPEKELTVEQGEIIAKTISMDYDLALSQIMELDRSSKSWNKGEEEFIKALAFKYWISHVWYKNPNNTVCPKDYLEMVWNSLEEGSYRAVIIYENRNSKIKNPKERHMILESLILFTGRIGKTYDSF